MIESPHREIFRERYANLPVLLVHRSLERARTPGEAFDILETVPATYPVIWDEEQRRWVVTDDLLLSPRKGGGDE